MAERIDELQLLIGSDATRAIEQLGNLADALDNAASHARKLSSATAMLSSFSVGLSRIANTNLDKAINGLERLARLDLSNLKDKKINIELQVNGADRADRLKYATEQAAKSIVKNSDQIAKSLGQEYSMDTSSVSEMREMVKEYVNELKAGHDGNDVIKAIANHIEDNARKSTADILGMRGQLEEFIKYVNNMHISPGDKVSSDAKGFWRSLGLERQMKNGSVGIDSIWKEDDFKRVASGLVDLQETNPENMFWLLGEAVMNARSALNGYVSDAATFERVQNSVNSVLNDTKNSFEEGITRRMAQSKNAIPLDLDIDQARFESQIQKAITEATSNKTYTAQPIKFNIDTNQLRENIDHALSLVSVNSLPQFAESFKTVSDSISTLNQTNLKDTGIKEFSNALRRLVSTDTSKFDVNTFKGIAESIKDMSKIGSVDKTLNGFVSSIARLASAGEKTGLTAEGLKKLIPELKEAVKAFSSMTGIDATVTSFVASIAKLASAGAKADKTAEGLGKLTTAVVEFLNALSSAPAINENIAATIQGLGNLAAAGTNTGKAMNSVLGGGGMGQSLASNAVQTALTGTANGFKKVLNASLQLGKQGASALGTFLGKLNLIPSHTNAIDRAALSFGNLLRAVLPFYGLRGLFDWGKEAFQAGSSIVELENVIDVAFGDLGKGYEKLNGYIYKWAQGTIDAFGVSQIAAEQYAGRLMSMFNSSGFDITEGMRDSAAKMTTDLIERAGDIASFYDITVDEAMTKIQSGLAGMTRPLRSIGVNMSVANMEAFALSQGITTSWQSMDQASQMALRYNYILHATQYAEGDFAATSLSAANQVRLLTLNFQQLSATLGQGLISAIAPVISWINLLIKRLIQAANAFRTFMWTLFGKPLAAARGTSDDLAGYLDDASGAASNLGGGAGDAAGGLGKAGKAAKELKKQLQVLPFDELNQLAKDQEAASSGGGGGGGGAGGGGLGDLSDMSFADLGDLDLSNSPTLNAINKWAQRIKDAFDKKQWKKMGIVIAEGLNEGLAYLYDVLDWGKWEPRVKGFIRPFQIVVNNMIDSLDWDLLGRTVARGLNLITNTFRIWINGFQWRNWGRKLAEGMNGLLTEVDADALGRAIADKFKAAWNFFGGWVRKFDFKLFGQRLKEGVLGALDEMDWPDMGESLGELFNGISDSIIAFFNDGSVASKLAKSFGEFVNGFIKKFDADKAKEAMGTVKSAIKDALSQAIANIDKTELAGDFKKLLDELPWGTIGLLIGANVGAKLAAGIFGSAFKAAALKAITGVGSSATIGGVASAGASTAGKAASAAGGGATLGGTLGGLAGLIGGMKALQKAVELNTRAKGIKPAEDYMRGEKMFTDDYDADISSGTKATPIDTGVQSPTAVKQESIITTILKGVKDKSFTDLETAKASLISIPIVKKTMTGTLTKTFNRAWSKFTDTDSYQAIKKFGANISDTFSRWWPRYTDTGKYQAVKKLGASISPTFNTWWKRYIDTGKYQAVKTLGASISPTLSSWWKKFIDQTDYAATKTMKAVDGGNFVNFTDTWRNLRDKTIDLTVNLVKKVQDLGAWISGKWQDLITFVWNAKGGLFTGPTGFQVFGEAGAEAAIPLERKSTMKRIASAIVDSGGMDGIGASSGMAREIAMAVAPYIMDAISETSNRPVNVNATLYTENDEVLARAVTRGQRSIDKRYNPVSQFSY